MKLVNNEEALEVILNVAEEYDDWRENELEEALAMAFFAIDGDGEVWAYSAKPKLDELSDCWEPVDYFKDEYTDIGWLEGATERNAKFTPQLFTRKQLIL